jgi:hypothetical protein
VALRAAGHNVSVHARYRHEIACTDVPVASSLAREERSNSGRFGC